MFGLVFKVVIVVFIIYLLIRLKQGKRNKPHKVTSIQRPRPDKAQLQACSYCRRKVNQLSFYSDGRGKVVGVCSVCKPQAERQGLMRL
jgi:hypothetical protein